MAATHRIQSATGRWAKPNDYGDKEDGWISQDLVELWREAAAKAGAGAAKSIERALALCEELGGVTSKHEVVMPLDAKRQARANAILAKAKTEFMRDWRDYSYAYRRPGEPAPTKESEWESRRPYKAKQASYEAAAKRTVGFVGGPCGGWPIRARRP